MECLPVIGLEVDKLESDPELITAAVEDHMGHLGMTANLPHPFSVFAGNGKIHPKPIANIGIAGAHHLDTPEGYVVTPDTDKLS